MAIKFIKTPDPENKHSYVNTEVTIPDDIALPELLECFEDFIRGLGYKFDGTVDLVEEE